MPLSSARRSVSGGSRWCRTSAGSRIGYKFAGPARDSGAEPAGLAPDRFAAALSGGWIRVQANSTASAASGNATTGVIAGQCRATRGVGQPTYDAEPDALETLLASGGAQLNCVG